MLSGADGFEVLGWSLSAKGLMWPVVVEAVCEGVDEGLQPIEAVRQVEGRVELARRSMTLVLAKHFSEHEMSFGVIGSQLDGFQ